MEIPLIIGDKDAGKATISQCGLYTVAEAALECVSPGLVRLWAHGGGKSVCLGVMEPRDGGLRLQRRFSRLELRGFPDPIEYVSDSEISLEPPAGEGKADTESAAEERDEAHSAKSEPAENGKAEEIPKNETRGLHNTSTETISPDVADEQPLRRETGVRACPWPAPLPEEGLTWYTRPDGSLVSFDGISNLLALPSGLHAPAPHAAERIIEGKKYLVFRY